MTEMKYMRMIKGLAGIENHTMNNKGTVLCEKLEHNNGNQTAKYGSEQMSYQSHRNKVHFFGLPISDLI